MQDMQIMFRRQLKYIFYLLALFVLGWGFTEHNTLFAGLVLGLAFGALNIWLLMRNVTKIGEAAAKGIRVRSLGSVSRFASAILAAMIALKYPDEFDIIATVLGLVTSYVVMIIDFLIHKSKR